MTQRHVNRLICFLVWLRFSITDRLWLWWSRLTWRDGPLVTVYIPTYNRADLLMSRALPSVLAQTYRELDVVVVDDCSTDDTVARVRALGDPRVRVLSTGVRGRRYPPTADNHWLAGPVVAANTALADVRGAYVARIDDDDEWSPWHIQTALSVLRSSGAEFVSSAYRVITPAGERVVAERPISGTQTWVYRAGLAGMRYNLHCWRKTSERVNDLDLADRMLRAGVRTVYFSGVMATVRARPGETAVGAAVYRENAERYERFYAPDPSA